MARNKFIFITLFLGLSSCTTLQRSSKSGYYNENEAYGQRSPGSSAPDRQLFSSDRERYIYENRSELERLESSLNTDAEFTQYQKYKSYLKTDREKIEFLKMRDRNAQYRWLKARGFNENGNLDPRIQKAIEEGDIMYGMGRDAVRKAWGDPEAVEVAGNPDFGNERWVYSDFEGSSDGYQKEERFIYFERGKVVGWESR